ncbi:yellow-b [Drosophila busckii]|uniref:Yellow-b n=1 Tax=Drosophila busckii TaxID=30019 RepID=A0A0M4E8X2_DROBS|nr:protein yellow [Drosophila busckii]ALC39395.1 yellow-b [Drosophila busckii]ALC39452.1 yellow-b [Drosophila busckii]
MLSICAARAALLLCVGVGVALGKDNLRVAYEWREMDFKYESDDARWTAIESGAFKPANVIPFGIELHRQRLFVTLPRWRHGVPATLGYLDLNDTSSKMPVLQPYPSWVAHNLAETEPELVSPFRVRADRCGRLWVLDSRIAGVLEQTKIYGSAQLLVYDLHNDDLLRRYAIPASQSKTSSFFANLAVEDADCEHSYAYVADLGAPGLVVYSWHEQTSWRVSHHFFHPDPVAGNFSINDIEFQWDDGLYGLALSKPAADGFATLYFHPLSSTMEFSVNTAVLRNQSLASSSDIYREFKVLGSRGNDMQAGAQFLDTDSDVLFYSLPNQNSIGCWRTQLDYKLQDRVQMSDTELIFPSDVKIDAAHNLWVLSNQLQSFIYDELYPGSINFRILKGSVASAIEQTMCNVPKPLPKFIDTLHKTLNNTLDKVTQLTQAPSSASSLALSLAALSLSCLVWLQA